MPSATAVVVTVLVGLATVAGLLGAAWPYFRGKQVRTYTELLEKSLATERQEAERYREKAKAEAAEAESRCSEAIAELRGRVGVLTNGFATVVAEAVVAVVRQDLVADLAPTVAEAVTVEVRHHLAERKS